MQRLMDKVDFRVFCFVLSLQSGVVMTVILFPTLLSVMVLLNVHTMIVLSAWSFSNIIGLVVASGHAVLVLLAIMAAFNGAWKEKYSLMEKAAGLMALALLVYFAATIISFVPGFHHYVCPVDRCPDHVWLHNSYWRKIHFEQLSNPEDEPPVAHSITAAIISVIFNILYTGCLIYVILSYIAFRTELLEEIPIGYGKEDWLVGYD